MQDVVVTPYMLIAAMCNMCNDMTSHKTDYMAQHDLSVTPFPHRYRHGWILGIQEYELSIHLGELA